MTVSEVFGDIAELIARMAPEKVAAIKAPAKLGERVSDLVWKKKEGVITEEEAFELERFLALDIFISLTKARALTMLSAS